MSTTKPPKRSLNYEDFELTGLSYNEKGQKLVIHYRERQSRGGGWTCESPEVPAPEIPNSLAAFKPYAAIIMGLQNGWSFAREAVKDDLDKLANALQGVKEADEAITNIQAVALFGDEENRGVKIKGSYRTDFGVSKFAHPVVRFDSEKTGIEKTLEKLYEDCNAAAYGFIYQGKRKQLTIEEQAEQDRKKGKNKKQQDLFKENSDLKIGEEREVDPNEWLKD